MKKELYLQALLNLMKETKENQSYTRREFNDYLKKIILYGVKFINAQCVDDIDSAEEAERFHMIVIAISDSMGLLTPNEFLNIFPINKEYNGHKYQSKDYFYTMEYLNALERDKPIKDQSMDGGTVIGFLWEYCNMEVQEFTVALMTSLSRLQRLNGEPTITDSLTEMLGVKSYTLCESNGKQFLLDTNGKTQRLCKKTPRYLKLIK